MDSISSADPNPNERESSQRPLTPLGVAQWIERAALVDTLSAASQRRHRPITAVVARHGSVVGYGAPELDTTVFNRVFVGGEGEAPTADDLARVLDELSGRGVAVGFVHVHEQDQAPALDRALQACGVGRYRRAWIKLSRGGGPVVACPTRLSIRAASVDDAASVADLIVQAHALHPDAHSMIVGVVGRPGWHSYVACDRGRPVAAAMLMVRGDTGYLCNGATHSEYRRQGAQSALLEKRLRVAFALGCRRVVSETGEATGGQPNPSYDNMCRLGLVPIGRRDNYARAGVTWR